MKVLFNQRPDQILGPEVIPEDPRIFEDAEESDDEDIFEDTMEEQQTSQTACVWDDTRAQVVTCGGVSLRFVDPDGKRLHKHKNIEITCGSQTWYEGHGWSIELHGGKIYSTGFNDKEPRCYILRRVNRRTGSQKGNWVWDQPSLPASHPIAKKMIAEVKIGMNFN